MNFFAIILFASILSTAGEASVLTVFKDEDKAKAATFMGLGQILGICIGFNIFTPMNDISWLNDYIFTTNPVDGPLLTYRTFCMMISVLFFRLGLMPTLFLGEK